MSYKDEWITEREGNKKSFWKKGFQHVLVWLGTLFLPLVISLSMIYTHVLECGNEPARNLVGFLAAITVLYGLAAFCGFSLFWLIAAACLSCAKKIQEGDGGELSGSSSEGEKLKQYNQMFKGLYFVKSGFFNSFQSTISTLFNLTLVVVLAASGWEWTAFFFLFLVISTRLVGKGVVSCKDGYMILLNDDTFTMKLKEAESVIDTKAIEGKPA